LNQIASARARAQARRRQARARRHQFQHPAERVNVGMIVAALAVLGAVGMAAMVSWNSPRRYRGATVAAGVEDLRAAIRDKARNMVAVSPGGGVIINIPALPTPDALATNANADLAEMVAEMPSHYLIINDHPDLRSPAVRDRVAQIGKMLATIGFEPLDNSDLEATLDARIRTEVSRVGNVDIEKNQVDDAEELVGSLLGSDEQLADLGCVVWIARGSRNNILTWVLTPDCLDSETDDRILSYLTSRN
jgi:hypothetical protein